MNPPRLRILVADDSASDRMILEALLRRQGHEVMLAKDGLEAVRCFEEWHPDLVLLDVMMPELDGIGAARRMRELSLHELVPIIFLTALHQASDLAACLDAGGDDFLSKPYNPVILEAKIKAFSRLRNLHTEVKMQREYLVAEQQAAKSIFDKITNHGELEAANVRYLMSPMVIFNGDVLLVAREPGGDILVLLGDFTGHGLPAAIGIMPMAEIFYGMVSKSFGLESILREINARLKAVLPASIFCCATALQLDYRNRKIGIWAGGLPPGLVLRRDSGTTTVIPSTHLPLGVLSPERFRYVPMMLDMQPGDLVYLWSDGIIEARNPEGELFGNERLMALFQDNQSVPDMFGHITQSLRDFTQQGHQSDDYSLVEIRSYPDGGREELEQVPAPGRESSPQVAGQWSLEYSLCAESLKASDPVPQLMQVLMAVPGLSTHAGVAGTILSELYANALEHGVLGLESSMKCDADGFKRYYQLREQRLQALQDASVCIRAEVQSLAGGGVLRLYVKDSGPGFDVGSTLADCPRPAYYGRGLTLLASLCRHVEHFPPGNEVMVEFVW